MSTQLSYLFLHQEKQVCRARGYRRPRGKAVRELGLNPHAESRAFSNYLPPLGAEGPKKPGHRKGGYPRVELESRSW